MEKVDHLYIAGAMVYTFDQAQGRETGKSLVEPDMIETAKGLLADFAAAKAKVHLPVDSLVADKFEAGARTANVPEDAIPSDMSGLDLGTESIAQLTALI